MDVRLCYFWEKSNKQWKTQRRCWPVSELPNALKSFVTFCEYFPSFIFRIDKQKNPLVDFFLCVFHIFCKCLSFYLIIEKVFCGIINVDSLGLKGNVFVKDSYHFLKILLFRKHVFSCFDIRIMYSYGKTLIYC